MTASEAPTAFDLKLSRHAITRLRQRGFRPRDVDLVVEHGTVTHDGILLSRKDVEREIELLRKQLAKRPQRPEKSATIRRRIGQLERLSGTAVYIEEGTVVSVYRPCPERCSRMIREGRSRVAGRRSWKKKSEPETR